MALCLFTIFTQALLLFFPADVECIITFVHQQGAGIQSGSVPHISTAEMVLVSRTNWLSTGPKKPTGLKQETANLRCYNILSTKYITTSPKERQDLISIALQENYLFRINTRCHSWLQIKRANPRISLQQSLLY